MKKATKNKQPIIEVTWEHGLTYNVPIEPKLLNSVLKHYNSIPYVKHVKKDGIILEYVDDERKY